MRENSKGMLDPPLPNLAIGSAGQSETEWVRSAIIRECQKYERCVFTHQDILAGAGGGGSGTSPRQQEENGMLGVTKDIV